MKNFLSKIFSKSTNDVNEQVPVPATKEPPTLPVTAEDKHKKTTLAPIVRSEEIFPQYVVGCAQSTGQQRNHNEDSLFTFTSNLSNHGDLIAFGLYIVADGMGGHKNGEIASSLAVKTLAEHVLNQVFYPILQHQGSAPEESIQEILQSGVQMAHQTIIKNAKGGGTTLTAALMINEQGTIAQIGDSRCYSISSDGVLNLITRDHSLVMRMIELGQLSPEEASVHPQRNVLYRALGQGEPLTADIQTHSLPLGGLILICSDGLWGVVPEQNILNIIFDAPDLQQACEQLISAANQAGGPDNITAILIRIPDEFNR